MLETFCLEREAEWEAGQPRCSPQLCSPFCATEEDLRASATDPWPVPSAGGAGDASVCMEGKGTPIVRCEPEGGVL